ncbi:Fe(3+) ions import ATP-binding protein FbpC 2 [Sinobacterium norvegicum]|uniref:Fe(3+) ions import ATP-binding protein FbpC 2 n=1 Tax=Sinobacterium norvegicum TaxID=1641715 RepID=A0ABN8EQX9_9GAMM|nr:ABC transporter ATP-binding protein [Sinobacterium norvegicum]CAH0993413.1 Fe(3+) ions import ATP-binding protein FbpC 2 [Sinobacterium norvegicum]
MPALLTVENIECRHQDQVIIKDLSFHINAGEICCLLGSSGCGKTTVLRAIAGFNELADGAITLAGERLSDQYNTTPPEQRPLGMVFQDYALFPHLTVAQNICFGIHKKSQSEQRETLTELLTLTHLSGFEKRYPHELSGGQQQRVALARALAPKPRLLLMDEPFSNLDAELRKRLNLEVRDILKALDISAILVTHDQEEAFAFADQIGLIHEGRLTQWDTGFNLYHEPYNRFVANFIGRGSLIKGTLIAPDKVTTELGEISGNRAYSWPTNSEVEVLLRPDDIEINSPDEEGYPATISYKLFSGSSTLYKLTLDSGIEIEALIPSHHDYSVNQTVRVNLHVEHLVAFSADE